MNLFETVMSYRYNQLPEISNKNILEIGAGTGIIQMQSTKSHIFKQNKYLGIDIEHANSNLNIVQSDFLEFEANEKFDLIIAFEFLEHVPLRDWDEVLKKIDCLLYKGGKFIFTVPYRQKLELDFHKSYFMRHVVHNIDKNFIRQVFQNKETDMKILPKLRIYPHHKGCLFTYLRFAKNFILHRDKVLKRTLYVEVVFS